MSENNEPVITYADVFAFVRKHYKCFGVAVLINLLAGAGISFVAEWLQATSFDWAKMITPSLVVAAAFQAVFMLIFIAFRSLQLVEGLQKKIEDVSETSNTAFEGVQSGCRHLLEAHLCRLQTEVDLSGDNSSASIPDFIDEHIKDFLDILETCRGHADKLYAVDATSPEVWWENTMIGYLAMQANEYANGLKHVSRLFVWPPEDINKRDGRRLLLLHHFLGFSTYITTPAFFSTLLKKAKVSEAANREFMVLDAHDYVALEAIKPERQGCKSFWLIEEARNPARFRKLNKGLWWDYYNNTPDLEQCKTLFKSIKKQSTAVSTSHEYNKFIDETKSSIKEGNACVLKLVGYDLPVLRLALGAFQESTQEKL